MSAIQAPYGFKPINRVDGLPYAGAIRQIPVASNNTNAIFNGSVVSILANGTVALVTTDGSVATPFPAGTIGVFVGCSYTNAVTKQPVYSQYLPAATIASDIMAFVVDDPNVVFQVQAAGTLAQAELGANVVLNATQVATAGSTATGNSATAVSITTVQTATAFRIVDFVKGPFSTVGDAFTDVLVKFNPGHHSYLGATGI